MVFVFYSYFLIYLGNEKRIFWYIFLDLELISVMFKNNRRAPLMVSKLSESIALFLIQKNCLDKQEYESAVYVLTKRFLTLFYFPFVLLIGSITYSFGHTLLFLVACSLLRQRVGGYHAPTPPRCFIGSIGVVMLGMFLSRMLSKIYPRTLSVCLLLISILIILAIKPYSHPALGLSLEELEANRKRAYLIIIGEVIITTGLLLNPRSIVYGLSFCCGIFCAACLLLLGIFKKGECEL